MLGSDLITENYSRLVDILGQQELAGKSFYTLLENIVSGKDTEAARAFIKLLFDQTVKEELIGDLNPLKLIEVTIAQTNGVFITKQLQFNFARAYQKNEDDIKEISHALVTVQDITEQVKLERALKESRTYNETQLEMITGLLHAHPGMFKEFQLHTQVEQLIEKLSQFASVSNNMPLLVSTNQNIHSYRNDGWDHLDDFVQNIAMRNSKQVKLVVSGLSELALDVGYQKKLKEICIQLLRNAVVHGIETPAVRALSEKPLIARIDLRLAKVSDTEMELMVMDDGRGLDYAAIRTKALQSGSLMRKLNHGPINNCSG